MPPPLQNARPHREAASLQDLIKENEVRLQESYHLLCRLQLLLPSKEKKASLLSAQPAAMDSTAGPPGAEANKFVIQLI